jgi:hypothetical protein
MPADQKYRQNNCHLSTFACRSSSVDGISAGIMLFSPGLSPDSVAANSAPQSDSLQNPYRNRNHNYDVQNGFDAGSHGNVAIDQVQSYADDNQRDHKIYQRHVLSPSR